VQIYPNGKAPREVLEPDPSVIEAKILNQTTPWDKKAFANDPRLSDAALRASIFRKAYLVGVMLFFHIVPIYLAKMNFVFLDDLSEMVPNLGINSWCRSTWDGIFISGRLSKFQICFFFSVFIHQVTYFTWCAHGFISQFLPFMTRYRVQEKYPSFAMQWNCFRYVFLSQICFQVPFLAFVYVFSIVLDLKFEYDAIPKWYQLSLSILGCSCLEDTWHFWIHWLGHHKKVYKYVHKVHHEHTFPFALTTEYAHPVEQVVLGFGFVIGLVIYGTHICFVWLWMAFRLLESCEVHSGYEFCFFFNPFRLMPWYGGISFHDFHHENFVGNYSSFYCWWDEICDTNVMYKRRNLLRSLQEAQRKQE